MWCTELRYIPVFVSATYWFECIFLWKMYYINAISPPESFQSDILSQCIFRTVMPPGGGGNAVVCGASVFSGISETASITSSSSTDIGNMGMMSCMRSQRKRAENKEAYILFAISNKVNVFLPHPIYLPDTFLTLLIGTTHWLVYCFLYFNFHLLMLVKISVHTGHWHYVIILYID